MTPPWRSALYLIWALTSFLWLVWLGGWVIDHEGPGPGHSLPFLIGTLWAGSFFAHLISKH